MATTTQFAFVTYDGVEKQTPAERSQVRSHCMKGRNKRKGSRRSDREARRAAKQAASTNVDTGAVLPTIKGRSSSATAQRENASISTTILRRVKQRSESPDERSWARPQAPRGFAFGEAVDQFANAVGQTSESLIRQCKTASSIGSRIRLTSI